LVFSLDKTREVAKRETEPEPERQPDPAEYGERFRQTHFRTPRPREGEPPPERPAWMADGPGWVQHW
jgi:hypothetical protein